MVAPPIIGANVFSENFKTSGTLYIPAGTRSIYVERGWSLYFANIVEMEDGEPIWLSVVDAEQGCTELRCKAGETYTFRFKPANGWHVHSVMFRGAEVTSWLTDEGEFTTPAMSASTDLVITYEQGTNAVKAIADESDMRVVVINNDIVVRNAPAGTPISIYDLSGHLLGSATATNGTTRVQAPNNEKVVIVKVRERTVKVAR